MTPDSTGGGKGPHGVGQPDARSCWIRRIAQERGRNRAALAVANKNARIIWALLTRQETYRFAS